MKFNLVVILFLLILQFGYAQDDYLKVLNATLSESEFVGSNIKDPNGRTCAAIKVVSSLDGFKYKSYNGIVKQNICQGRIWFMCSRMNGCLKFTKPDLNH